MGVIVEYWYPTRAGRFFIRRTPEGRWEVKFEDERLGRYATAQHALDDLAGGSTDWPSCGNPAKLGLPDEVGDWYAAALR